MGTSWDGPLLLTVLIISGLQSGYYNPYKGLRIYGAHMGVDSWRVREGPKPQNLYLATLYLTNRYMPLCKVHFPVCMGTKVTGTCHTTKTQRFSVQAPGPYHE